MTFNGRAFSVLCLCLAACTRPAVNPSDVLVANEVQDVAAFEDAVQKAATELRQSNSAFVVRPRYEREQQRLAYGLGGVAQIGLTSHEDRFALAVFSRVQTDMLAELLESKLSSQQYWRPI